MTASPVEVTESGPPDAPALILSNSLGATVAMWEPQLAALSEVFRVIRYDYRGHGASAAPPGPYALADLGTDVLGLLDRLGVARTNFCGVSLGGMVGMWLAAHHPERIDRLALCATSAALGPPEAWAERAATVRASGVGAVAAVVVGRWFTPGYAEAHPAVITRMVDMVSSTDAEAYASCCRAIETMDLLRVLATITAPTLVIAAEDDPSTPPGHGRAIAEGIPGARFVVVPDGAHLVSIEQSAVVTPLLLEHLRGVG